MSPTTDVLFLTRGNDLGRIAARKLAAAFPDLKIVVEQPVARSTLLRGRIRRLGPLQVAGQMAFMAFARALYFRSRPRIAEILEQHRLEPRWPEGCERIEVPSVNSPECIAAIERIKPRVILVLGTRIVNRKTLAAIKAPLINYHAGITPKYRGIHGGYWAKAEGDLENFGVTVHLIDPGIDTGAVLYQARLAPARRRQLRDLPVSAARRRAAADRAGRARRARRQAQPADRDPAVAAVVAPDHLELPRGGPAPRRW